MVIADEEFLHMKMVVEYLPPSPSPHCLHRMR
jgi:hypothetical protein